MHAASPFTPQRGVVPRVLVARGEILRIVEDLVRDTRPHAPAVLEVVGGRSMGKTVLLRHLVNIRARLGATVSVGEPFDAALERAAREHGTRARGARTPLVYAIDNLDHRGSPSRAELDGLVDRAHAVDRPVVFVATHTKIPSRAQFEAANTGDRRMVGCNPLTRAGARVAIERPLLDTGVRIEPDALDHLVRAAVGVPLFAQMLGAAAWDLRRRDTIDSIVARRAVSDLQVQHPIMRRPVVVVPRLDPIERSVLSRAALPLGTVAARLPGKLDMAESELTGAIERLAGRGLVSVDDHMIRAEYPEQAVLMTQPRARTRSSDGSRRPGTSR